MNRPFLLVVVFATMLFATASVAASGPTDVTGGAVNITTVQAALQGTVNPNGGTAVDYHFAYGPATTPVTYPHGTTWTSVGAGTTAVSVQQTLTGLTPGTVYHYRLETRYTIKGNSSNTSQGADATFTTATTAPPPSNTVAPTVSGIPMPAASGISGAGTLIATAGTWTGSPSFTYQWQDCDATGANCQNATGAGATTSSYTVGVNDTTGSIRVQVTASNASGSAAATAITGPAPAFWAVTGVGGQSSGSAIKDANLLRLTSNGNSASEVDAYHTINPHMIVLQYDNGYRLLTNPNAIDVGSPCRDANVDISQANGHAGDPAYDWFIYHPTGFPAANRFTFYDPTANGGQNVYIADVGNGAWQQSCATQDLAKAAAVHLTGGHNDGVLLDNMDLSVSHQIGGQTGIFPGFPLVGTSQTYNSDGDWNNALISYVAALHQRFLAAGMIGPIVNIGYGLYFSGSGDAYNRMVDATDGSEEQGFVSQSLSASQDAQSVAKINEGVYNESKGKWFIASYNSPLPPEPKETLLMADFLQEANGHSVFDVAPSNGAFVPFTAAMLDAMQLGPALGPYQTRTVGGQTVLERDFVNGVAISNLNQTATVSFSPTPGGTYSGRDCSAVNNTCTTLTNASSLSLGPDGGAVLLH